MRKKLLFTILGLGLALNVSYGQFDIGPTGFYDHCSTMGSGNNFWTYWTTGPNGGVSQSQSAGAIQSVCSGINTNVLVTANVLTTPINLSNVAHQKLNVRLKSDAAMVLYLQLSEGGGVNYKLNWLDLPVLNVPGDDTYHDYAIDFSGYLEGGANMAIVNEIGFIYFDPTPISPTVSVDYLDVGNFPGSTLAPCLTKTATFLAESGCTYNDYPNYTWSYYIPGGGALGGGNVAMYQGSSPTGSIAYDVDGLYAGTEYPSIANFDITSGSPGINLSSTCSQKYFIRLKSTVAIPLALQMRDENMEFKLNWAGPILNIPGDDTYHDYQVDFSTFIAGGVNMANVGNVLLFYPGTTPISGTITVDSMSLGSIVETVTTAASGLHITNITPTSMTINWTNGTGQARIVQVGYSGLDNPVDGTTYTGNAVYGSGSDITGFGYNYIVYNGTGNSVTVTGLESSSFYSVGVYEYNTETCGPNYKTDAIASDSRAPLGVEPTLAASNLNFSSITQNSMTVNWDNGNGSRRIVIAKQNGPVDQIPSDFGTTNYTASSVFASGTNLGGGNYVVFDGTSNNFNLTGLTASTNYHFTVLEYNENFGYFYTRNYNTSSPPTGNQTTNSTGITEPTIPASNLIFSSVNATSFTINWTNGNGAGRIVVVKQGSAVNADPTDNTTYIGNALFSFSSQIGTGNYVVFLGTGSSVTVTGLTASTTYHVEVFEFNGLDATSNYLTSSSLVGNQTTNAAAVTEPTTAASNLLFSSVNATSFTINWTNGNGAGRIVVVKQGSAVDTDPSDNTAYTANAAFTSGSQIGTGNYVVFIGTGSSVTVTGLTASTTYHVEVYEFNGTGASSNFLTSPSLVGNQTTNAAPTGEPTVAASNILFSSVNSFSMTINWTNGNGVGRIVVVHEGSPVTSAPADNNGYTTANSNIALAPSLGGGNYIVYNGTGSSVTVTGLTAGTAYYFSIYEYNGAGATADYLTSTFATNNESTATVTNVNDATEAERIVLYPNPNTGHAQLDLSSIHDASQLQVINNMGLVVRQIEIDRGVGIIDLDTSTLPSGVYLISIKKSDNTLFTKKMIRN